MQQQPLQRFYSFPPLAGDDITVLILGSLPGARSLAAGEYYAHPRNRFWSVIAAIARVPSPLDYPARKALLARLGVGLWDVAHAATRPGSLDSNIRDETSNDIPRLIAQCPRLRLIAFNGQAPARLFNKHFPAPTGITRVTLPGTSPANAAWSFERLLDAWNDALAPFLLAK